MCGLRSSGVWQSLRFSWIGRHTGSVPPRTVLSGCKASDRRTSAGIFVRRTSAQADAEDERGKQVAEMSSHIGRRSGSP